jgi:triose/dihydroxyacetone kinase / FAD-AMP lyase (cyclizing)
MEISVTEVLELLDAPTAAPAWPKNSYAKVEVSKDAAAIREKAKSDERGGSERDMGQPGRFPNHMCLKKAFSNSRFYFLFTASDRLVRAIIEGCNRAIAAEPDITKFDIQMGDGDCGEAVESVCRSILSKISTLDAKSTPVFTILESLNDSLEDMGGSLGAILSILLTAFSNHLRAEYSATKSLSASGVAKSVNPAMKDLMQYTSARVGDRTVMDALIPFCDTLERTVDFESAVKAAEAGAEQTRGMKARFGRATYVGEDRVEQQQVAPPDPGAHAAAVFLRGLVDGLSS